MAELDLEQLLIKENALILSGNLSDLQGLADRKEAAIAASDLARADEDSLRRLQRLARRNSTLLSASIEGVRAARGRFTEMAEVHDTLTTYSATGQRSVEPSRNGFGRKV